MKTVWQGRVTQATGKYGEHAPMAAVCCNACRACVQTNILAAVLAALIGLGGGMARLAGRLKRPVLFASGRVSSTYGPVPEGKQWGVDE